MGDRLGSGQRQGLVSLRCADRVAVPDHSDAVHLAVITLESLRGADDALIAATLRSLAGRLSTAAQTLADEVGTRFFTLAHGTDQAV